MNGNARADVGMGKKQALHNAKEGYNRPDRTGMGAGYGNGSRIGKTVVTTMKVGQPDNRSQGSKQGFGAKKDNTSPVGFGKIGSRSNNGRGSKMTANSIGGKGKINKEDICRAPAGALQISRGVNWDVTV